MIVLYVVFLVKFSLEKKQKNKTKHRSSLKLKMSSHYPFSKKANQDWLCHGHIEEEEEKPSQDDKAEQKEKKKTISIK